MIFQHENIQIFEVKMFIFRTSELMHSSCCLHSDCEISDIVFLAVLPRREGRRDVHMCVFADKYVVYTV